jgi:hypothetical protein
MQAVLGVAFVCVGLALLFNAFSPALRGRIVARVTSAGFGIIAMEVGALRYAESRGFAWATPEFRATVFSWVCGSVAVAMLVAWIAQLRIQKRNDDTND